MGGQITEYLARRVDDHRPQVDSDARSKFARLLALSVQLGERALDRKSRPHRVLSIILPRYGITEQRHKAIAELSRMGAWLE